jgi:hypothetical protein
MRLLEIESLELIGGDRRIEFEAGLNIVLGPMASGKTTIVKLLRALFTSMPDDLAAEVQEHVTSVRATSRIGESEWHILRRLVATDTAIVEIVGDDETALVTARRATPAHPETLSDWLLQRLQMPRISVPAAPTRPESDPTPVTFSDYFNLCVLRDDEIDNNVFGHTHPFRDIKRKYVFEIAFGLYDSSLAELQSELRVTETELSYLRGEASAAERIFAGTELESIEAVRIARETRLHREQELLKEEAQLASTAARLQPASMVVRLQVEEVSSRLADGTTKARTAEAQIADLESLVQQLRSQEGRLTRAAVAGEALVDFEFVLCPRCGHQLAPGRGEEDTCALCLQEPPVGVLPAALRSERDRVEDQVVDTLDLIESRRQELESLLQDVVALRARRSELGRQLDNLTASFVSDHQQQLTALAAERARVRSEIEKYNQFLTILERAENAATRINDLSERRATIRQKLENASAQLRVGQSNIGALEARLLEYLGRLEVPTFGVPLSAAIDRRTYLPIVSGRTFDSLSSQGLQVLVNVAYALALHTVAVDRDLPLPGLLVIDGPSSNVGTEGYDAARLADIYRLLADVSRDYGDQMQILVVDNHVPPDTDDWIRVRFGEDDRLVRFSGADGQGDIAS